MRCLRARRPIPEAVEVEAEAVAGAVDAVGLTEEPPAVVGAAPGVAGEVAAVVNPAGAVLVVAAAADAAKEVSAAVVAGVDARTATCVVRGSGGRCGPA